MRHYGRRKAPCITNNRLATLLTEKTIEDLIEKHVFFSVTTDDLVAFSRCSQSLIIPTQLKGK